MQKFTMHLVRKEVFGLNEYVEVVRQLWIDY